MSPTPHVHDHDGTWDEWFAGDDADRPRWSGRPNGVLVAEVADLVPGRALDVGCGEGADAIWLARRGWGVTAVDPSRVALDRAEAAAHEADVEVTWVHAGLLEMPGGTGVHELVTAQYAALDRTDGMIGALLGPWLRAARCWSSTTRTSPRTPAGLARTRRTTSSQGTSPRTSTKDGSSRFTRRVSAPGPPHRRPAGPAM